MVNSNSSSARQAFFANFSKMAVDAFSSNERPSQPRPLVMLTGGLWTRAQFAHALNHKDADLLGLARCAILQPDLPLLLEAYTSKYTRVDGKTSDVVPSNLNEKLERWESGASPEPRSPAWWPRLVGVGVGMAWYTVGMRRIAVDRSLPVGRWWVLIVVEMYFGERGVRMMSNVIVVFGLVIFYYFIASIMY